MSNEDFGGLKFGTSQQPDDGCDWTSTIIWEMRRRARIRAQIITPRPAPLRVIAKEAKENAGKKSGKTKRAKSGKRSTGATGGNGNAATGSARKKRTD